MPLINPGDSIQGAVDANPTETSFCLAAGVHSITDPIKPKSGNTFTGQYGAIIDGSGWSVPYTISGLTNGAFMSHNEGTVDDVTIRNLEIRNMGNARGVHAWYESASGWIVEYCDIHDCFCGVHFGDSAIVRHNYIHDCNGDSNGGIYPNGGYFSTRGANSLVEQNHVSYCGDIQKVIDQAHDVTFRDNFIHHCDGPAIWYDDSCLRGVVETNLLEDNGLHGIFYEVSGDGIFRNNIIRRNGNLGGAAIYISTSYGNDIYGNELEDNYRGILLIVNLSAANPTGPLPYPGALYWDLHDNDVHHNIVQLTPANVPAYPISNGTTYVAGPLSLTPYTSNTKNNNFDYNHYYHPVGDAWLDHWDTLKTFAQWQALGFDIHGAIN